MCVCVCEYVSVNARERERREREEKNERVETLDSIVNDIKGHKIQTNRDKVKFAQEIKSGLGTKIKNNPNYIIIYKKPWYVKLGNFIKKIFTKF